MQAPTPSTPLLPEPIAAYFAADAHDLRAVASFASCFKQDAVVKDEGHTYVGQDAIAAWKAAASAAYRYTSEPLSIEQVRGTEELGDEYLVSSRVVGNFPGSPVVLRYRFRLAQGLIAALEITA